jgi:hypothetical protein
MKELSLKIQILIAKIKLLPPNIMWVIHCVGAGITLGLIIAILQEIIK